MYDIKTMCCILRCNEFSLTGKIASSHTQKSGENNRKDHGARQFFAMSKQSGTRECEEGYSKHILKKNFSLSVLLETDQKF